MLNRLKNLARCTKCLGIAVAIFSISTYLEFHVAPRHPNDLKISKTRKVGEKKTERMKAMEAMVWRASGRAMDQSSLHPQKTELKKSFAERTFFSPSLL
jgi:hypothetical protein